MTCPKCGSENVTIQAVSVQKKTLKNKVGKWVYWLCFIWVFDLILWIFLTLPRLIIALFRRNKKTTVIQSQAICQNCGNNWTVKENNTGK
jgi:transcription elongation factor Elf1